MSTLEIASVAATAALREAGLGDLISTNESDLYSKRIADYWSLAAQKKPYCIVHPKSTQDVAIILNTIVPIQDCRFAVRSGGHIAWAANNLDGGIVIDLGLYMTSVTVDASGIVSLQPGSRWRDVYKKLEPHGVTVAGGRTGGVGVGGFLTGGGISWAIPRVGFGCDQIVNMEVVLADGRVIDVNEGENSDLWRSLKGASGGNFGIVTRFDLRSEPDEGFWGGMLMSEFNEKNTADHIEAMSQFTKDSHQYPDSSYINLFHYEPTVFKNIMITTFAVNTRGIADPPELKQLCEIPTVVKDLKHTTAHDHACTMEQPYGYYNNWQTTTFLNDPRIMAFAVETHTIIVDKIKAASKTGHFSTVCLFQAFPNFYTELSKTRGGNVMGLEQHLNGRDAIMMLLSVNTSEDNIRELGQSLSQGFVKDVEDFAKSLDGYIDWKYFNYADEFQKPLSSLLDPATIAEVARKYDPGMVFQNRTPGHKITNV